MFAFMCYIGFPRAACGAPPCYERICTRTDTTIVFVRIQLAPTGTQLLRRQQSSGRLDTEQLASWSGERENGEVKVMEGVGEGDLEAQSSEPSLSCASDWGGEPSRSDQARLGLETHREGLEDGEIPDEEDGAGILSDVSDEEEDWNRQYQSLVVEHERICHSKTSETWYRQDVGSDTRSIVEISTGKAQKSLGKGNLLKKWLLSQSGFQEENSRWICEPEDMILWHGRKVSAGKASSELPKELFLVFERDLDELLRLNGFAGVRCDKLMDEYKRRLPTSAKEFKRIARMNNCSSTTLVKICLSNLREVFEVFPKKYWNGDGNQPSDTAVIQRKKGRRSEEKYVEEKRECSEEEIEAVNVSRHPGPMYRSDLRDGHQMEGGVGVEEGEEKKSREVIVIREKKKKRRRKTEDSRETRSQSAESQEGEKDSKSRKRKRSESSDRRHQKRRKASRRRSRSSDSTESSCSRGSRERKRSSSGESERRRGSKIKKRKKSSEEQQQQETTQVENKNNGTLVTDAAIQRILKVSLF